jgi:hypothetical protein
MNPTHGPTNSMVILKNGRIREGTDKEINCPQRLYSSISWGPRLMKRRSLVRIPPPPSCMDMSKKKDKEINHFS